MRESNSERGSTVIMVALMLTALIGFLALVVDVGMGYVERRRIQSVADAASLAGVQVLVNNFDNDAILAAVREYALVLNPPAAGETRRDPTDPTDLTVRWVGGAADGDPVTPGGDPPQGVSGIQVTVHGSTPTFFANLLGITTVSASATGSGGYSPLDVMLVIDRSISMEFYSCNFERFFATGQPCRSLIGSLTPEFDRITEVYYNCSDCRGVWRRPSWSQPYACYWPNNTRMTSAPAECATLGITTQTGCLACRGAIVSPEHPITEAKAAASYFIDLVEVQLAPTYPRIGLATYAVYGTLDVPLTYTLGSVRTGIAGIALEGNTNCEEGLYRARSELTSRGRITAVRAIIFLTDGRANLYRNCYDRSRCSESTARSRAIAEAHTAQDNRIRVYTIGLGSGADQAMLQAMVDDPGGDYDGAYVYADTGADLAAAYADLFARIKQLRLVQ